MTSGIDPTKPVDGAAALKSDLRNNLANAKTEIEALQAFVSAFPADAAAQLASLQTLLNTGMRNRIINGAMQIDQRNNGALVTVGGYTVDRWNMQQGVAGKLSGQQMSAPLISGVRNSLRLSATASYAAAAGEAFGLQQPIEGYNVADFQFGTPQATPIGVTFLARAAVAGTYCVALRNSATNRSYVTTFTLTAGVTQQISLAIPGDTSGTWLRDNGTGLSLWFDLGSGTTFTTATTNAWQAGNLVRATGTQALIAASGNTLEITNVQVEKLTYNTSARTPFEFRSISDEIMLCQRYYQALILYVAGYAAAGAAFFSSTLFPMMRAVPTATMTPTSYANASGASYAVDSNQSLHAAAIATASGSGSFVANITLTAEL